MSAVAQHLIVATDELQSNARGALLCTLCRRWVRALHCSVVPRISVRCEACYQRRRTQLAADADFTQRARQTTYLSEGFGR